MFMNFEREHLDEKGNPQGVGKAIIVSEPAKRNRRRKIKVIIVDDHDGVRAGIKGLLSREDDIIVVAEGANGREAIDLARQKNPDVMLLDVELPVMRGEEVVRQIRMAKYPVKVLAVSSYDDRQYIYGMLDNGAQGYITKEEASELLAEAIRQIFAGDPRWLSPRASRYSPNRSAQTTQSMTQREFEIMQMLSTGKNEADLARSINMAGERVKTYLQILKIKYGADSYERLIEVAKRLFRQDSD